MPKYRVRVYRKVEFLEHGEVVVDAPDTFEAVLAAEAVGQENVTWHEDTSSYLFGEDGMMADDEEPTLEPS